MARHARIARGCAVVVGFIGLVAHAWAEAPITEVVVYGDRAQVTRSQGVDCASKSAHFPDLPSTLDVKTLWASIDGGSVVGLTHREEASGPRPEAKDLQDQLRKIDEESVVAREEVSAAQASRRKLQSFKQHMGQVWGLQAAGRNPQVLSWDAALDLLRQQGLAAHLRQRQAETKLRTLRREQDRHFVELESMERKRRRTTITASVLLSCTGRRTVRLSYVVPAATWEMSYQMRSEGGGRIVLATQAAVAQGTGEDWNNVVLSVSTANLQRQNLPPALVRMRVSTEKPADARKVLVRHFEHRTHLTAGSPGVAPADPPPRPTTSAPAAQPPDVGLAQKLTAARQVTIPADGRRVTFELERRTITGQHVLETVPKLFPFVYRRVSLANPFPYTLLPGRVELFEGPTYVGQAEMKLRAPREPFAFSLGVDQHMQVRRDVKTEKLDGSAGHGSKKKLLHRYVIQVSNSTDAPRRVRVLENVPVSQVRDVEVTLSDDSTRPKEWNRTDGVLAWELDIGAHSRRELILDYTIHVPSDYAVEGY